MQAHVREAVQAECRIARHVLQPGSKNADRTGSSDFVTGGWRRCQVLNACLYFPTISGVRIFSKKAFVPQSAAHLGYRSYSCCEIGQYATHRANKKQVTRDAGGAT